jgi:hypothetical protein
VSQNYHQLHCRCRNVKAGLHAIWMDNFSKIIKRQCPSLLNGAWSGCLWTGVAVVKFFAAAATTITMDLVLDEEGVVPAMPDSLISSFGRVMSIGSTLMRETHLKYDASLCNVLQVNCIPLKPAAPEGDDRLASILAESRDGVGNLYPEAVLPPNIGSNLGLMSILKGFCDERNVYTVTGPDRYYIISCDINIYNRILKVKNFVHCLRHNVVVPMSVTITHTSIVHVRPLWNWRAAADLRFC